MHTCNVCGWVKERKYQTKGNSGLRCLIYVLFNSFLYKCLLSNSELLTQDNFIRSKGSLLLGRSKEIESIVEYATHGCLPGQARESTYNKTCPILLVQGVPGSGKSSLMAYCTLQAKKVNDSRLMNILFQSYTVIQYLYWGFSYSKYGKKVSEPCN